MPTKREREYYAMGFRDGVLHAPRVRSEEQLIEPPFPPSLTVGTTTGRPYLLKSKPKRKLSAWNKFVKANSKKKIYRYANGKLKLKKMGIAFRKKKRR
mgnify:CR=1 FL=1